ncbi:MAG TPA: hypothetical protein VJH55_04295 [Candidatus Paceibacterota bacterium]
MEKDESVQVSFMSLYHFGLWKMRCKPCTIVFTKDALLVKWWGYFNRRNIPFSDIQGAEVLTETWVNKWTAEGGLTFNMTRMNHPIVLTYKKGGKSTIDYIVGPEEKKAFILRKIGEVTHLQNPTL